MRRPLKEMLSRPTSEYVASTAESEIGKQPLSLSLMSQKSLDHFGNWAGFAVPQSIIDNQNTDTGHIAWGGVASDMGKSGALGIAIAPIFSYAGGLIRGKVNRWLGKEPSAEPAAEKK